MLQVKAKSIWECCGPWLQEGCQVQVLGKLSLAKPAGGSDGQALFVLAYKVLAICGYYTHPPSASMLPGAYEQPGQSSNLKDAPDTTIHEDDLVEVWVGHVQWLQQHVYPSLQQDICKGAMVGAEDNFKGEG